MTDRSPQIVRLKVLLVGPANSGKTTFLKSITTNENLLQYQPTAGTTFHNHSSKMLGPGVDLFMHFVDTSEAVVHSQEYLGALLNRTNITIVFFEVGNREHVAKAQTLVNTIRSLGNNNLVVPGEIAIIGSKNDMKLKTDLNANEILVRDFRDRCKATPSLLDCRNRAEMKTFLSEVVEAHVRKLHPELALLKMSRDTRQEEEKVIDEPKLLPKKDEGCSLI